MRKALLVLALFTNPVFFATAFAVSGVVVEKTGSLVLIRPNGEQKEARTGDTFDDGTTLSAKKGRALLLFADGTLLSLSPNQTLKRGEAPLKNGIPVGGLQNGLNAAFQQAKMGRPGERAPLDLGPPPGGIQGLYPVAGNMQIPPSILFRWKGKNISGENPALIFGESLFFVMADAKNISLSRQELSLEKGNEYRWYLGRVENDPHQTLKKPVAQSRVYSFRILSDKEDRRLQKELSRLSSLPTKTTEGREFLKAQVFYNYKMYHAMVDVLNSLHKKYRTPGIRKLLFLGYVRLGLDREAKKFETK